MRQVQKRTVVLFIPLVLVLLSGTDQQRNKDRFIHTVAAGESVSLICIDYYGYYADSLGTIVQTDNPSIKNINLIHVGQKLSLRKPVEASETRAAVVSKDSNATPGTVAEKLVTVTKKMSISQGVITCVEGTVHWRRTTQAKSQVLKINTVVTPGAVIETGADGRVEIIINREAVVRLRENTTTVLEAFRTKTAKKGKTRVKCPGGGWWTKVKKFKDRISRFELELPTAVAGVHGTVYETSVATDGSSEVKVFSGEVAVRAGAASSTQENAAPAGTPVEVSGPEEVPPPHEVPMEQWTEIVRSMQKLSIDKKGRPSSPVPFSRVTSDWVRWNEERDRRIAALFGE